MKVRLLNAAVMPRPGRYTMRALTREDFGTMLRGAYAAGVVESYVGYDAAADVIEAVSGVRPEVTRRTTPVEDGDVLLIARLKQRVQSQDPRVKAAMGRTERDPNSYEFFACMFESDEPSR